MHVLSNSDQGSGLIYWAGHPDKLRPQSVCVCTEPTTSWCKSMEKVLFFMHLSCRHSVEQQASSVAVITCVFP